MLVNCEMGKRPIYHTRPFIITYPVNLSHITHVSTIHTTAAARRITSQVSEVARHIPQYPHLQHTWVKDTFPAYYFSEFKYLLNGWLEAGHTMTPEPTDPYLLARIWIRQQGHGLNWLTAIQVVDSSDFAIIQKSQWSPYSLNPPRLQ